MHEYVKMFVMLAAASVADARRRYDAELDANNILFAVLLSGGLAAQWMVASTRAAKLAAARRVAECMAGFALKRLAAARGASDAAGVPLSVVWCFDAPAFYINGRYLAGLRGAKAPVTSARAQRKEATVMLSAFACGLFGCHLANVRPWMLPAHLRTAFRHMFTVDSDLLVFLRDALTCATLAAALRYHVLIDIVLVRVAAAEADQLLAVPNAVWRVCNSRRYRRPAASPVCYRRRHDIFLRRRRCLIAPRLSCRLTATCWCSRRPPRCGR